MKKVLLSAVALLAFGFANAQEEEKGNGGFSKGSIFMSGTVGFSSEKQDDVKVNEFTVAPKVGYFVTENIALGLGLGLGSGKVDEDGDTAAENKTTSFGAFGRYYLKTSKFAPFAELNVNYATTSTEYVEFMGGLTPFGSGEDVNTFSINLAPGFNYFVSDNFALETSVGILGYSSSKEDVSGAEAKNKFQLGLDFASINFGLVYKF
ncbi:outer membrane beta-barrel protein [Flavobacterium channae]|uniref:outer membrane beta-barrel protein n=1 Tax=Flavobacterium channae TaxID=2897181 RepID=UPI001E323A3B|nr:outer membrane beta-barrel protein [Flavobacterium channae]UGS22968.1 outer membrane beta-barrel protein [Flavobacterium channae]